MVCFYWYITVCCWPCLTCLSQNSDNCTNCVHILLNLSVGSGSPGPVFLQVLLWWWTQPPWDCTWALITPSVVPMAAEVNNVPGRLMYHHGDNRSTLREELEARLLTWVDHRTFRLFHSADTVTAVAFNDSVRFNSEWIDLFYTIIFFFLFFKFWSLNT